jgi:RNA polymerase sigma-70 factor, ECF subfamily
MEDRSGFTAGEDVTASLVRRARAGDATAFRSLYDAHVGRVHALSLRLMTDGAEAEELTQDVFVAAWRQLDSYRGDARFSTWLHGITVRLSRQRLRGLLRRRAREERYACDHVGAVSTALPTTDPELERVLAELPRRMRTALVLHAIEGYTQAETGELMGIAEGTVKAHVHRARALLQERLGRNG